MRLYNALARIVRNPLGFWYLLINYIFPTPFRFQRRSFSQEGEDLILSEILTQKDNGLYVDIGANHPFSLSNTYHFYQRGWKGVNIDAMPGSMGLFKKYRPRDINIECGISDIKANLKYYVFNKSELNTFNEKYVEKYMSNSDISLKNVIDVKVLPLEDVLSTYFPTPTYFDFISIDVEGMDLEVLLSNNWKKYRSHIVLVEAMEFAPINKINESLIFNFLQQQGYELIAKTPRTCFFRDTCNNIK